MTCCSKNSTQLPLFQVYRDRVGQGSSQFCLRLKMWGSIKAKGTRAQHMALASASSQWVERSSWGDPLRAPKQPAAAVDVADTQCHVMSHVQHFDIVLTPFQWQTVSVSWMFIYVYGLFVDVGDSVDACCGETWEINSRMPRESVWSECTTVSTWNNCTDCTRQKSIGKRTHTDPAWNLTYVQVCHATRSFHYKACATQVQLNFLWSMIPCIQAHKSPPQLFARLLSNTSPHTSRAPLHLWAESSCSWPAKRQLFTTMPELVCTQTKSLNTAHPCIT